MRQGSPGEHELHAVPLVFVLIGPDIIPNGSLRPEEPKIESAVQTTIANQELVGPAGPPPSTVPENTTFSQPSSPYTSQRATIRNLTLPSNPNLDIPPSPPGSPAPGADQKFAHFLQLKQQDVHFNAKLASSSALKNPSLLPKLMEFAGVKDQHQYATTLPTHLWDPEGFPEFAYKEELAKSQKEISKRKEEEKAKATREGIEFVSATNSGQSSLGVTPGIGVGSKAVRRSAAERVMAGLDRDRKSSPKMGAAGPKKEMERRGGKMDGAPPAASSRSPRRRKRSRSR